MGGEWRYRLGKTGPEETVTEADRWTPGGSRSSSDQFHLGLACVCKGLFLKVQEVDSFCHACKGGRAPTCEHTVLPAGVGAEYLGRAGRRKASLPGTRRPRLIGEERLGVRGSHTVLCFLENPVHGCAIFKIKMGVGEHSGKANQNTDCVLFPAHTIMKCLLALTSPSAAAVGHSPAWPRAAGIGL